MKEKIYVHCRTPRVVSGEEEIKRTKKLMEKGNADAFHHLAGYYAQGIMGLPQNWGKANELFLKAGELGCAKGYYNLGCSYTFGHGVEEDMNKALHYYELAAMGGNILARHNLGCLEGNSGNLHRAMKHFIMAAKAGDEDSVDKVKHGLKDGLVTKDEFANTLRACHERQKEMKSEMRDKAAAARRNDEYLEMV